MFKVIPDVFVEHFPICVSPILKLCHHNEVLYEQPVVETAGYIHMTPVCQHDRKHNKTLVIH